MYNYLKIMKRSKININKHKIIFIEFKNFLNNIQHFLQITLN